MSYKILIVDDSAVTRAVLKKTIAMTGVPVREIIEATNGRDAIDKLEHAGVDLIMADLNMPTMNGLEMTDKIFANDKTSHIPVVIVSTESSSTRIDQLQAKGVRGYVHKPFLPEQIRDVLSEVLDLSDMAEPV